MIKFLKNIFYPNEDRKMNLSPNVIFDGRSFKLVLSEDELLERWKKLKEIVDRDVEETGGPQG